MSGDLNPAALAADPQVSGGSLRKKLPTAVVLGLLPSALIFWLGFGPRVDLGPALDPARPAEGQAHGQPHLVKGAHRQAHEEPSLTAAQCE